jgi:hypothetical protein
VKMPSHFSESFPPEVVEQLKFYVYRLIDPRNGETFYIGKGKANRVFDHVRGNVRADRDGDDIADKMRRIREIQSAGFEVAHVIHRHGMDEPTAYEVEAALIDAYPGLTNEAGGHGGSEFGAMHARQIVEEFSSEQAIFRHDAILIIVSRSAIERTSLFEATHWAWKINPTKAQASRLVLAVVQGIIRGAFVVDQWLEASAANFPGKQERPGRYGFVGREAPEELRQQYVGKRVPEEYRKQGAANPIKYVAAANPGVT